MSVTDETIIAIASAPGAALRGIVRVSGPQTGQFFSGWLVPDAEPGWSSSVPLRFGGSLPLPGLNRPLVVNVQWWPNARSYTGQPLAEIHLIGSPPLLNLLLEEAYRRGARGAEPGEFTLRAFLAGRLDLLQAEGVLGVIDARGPRDLKRALEQLAGGISSRMAEIRGDLLELLADIEAGLDFTEEHLEFVSRAEIVRRVQSAREFVEGLQAQSLSRMHAGERPRVVLAGLPNAGKSTLFNALAGEARALVSEEPGTTRDYVVTPWRCGEWDVELVDTAGWEAAVSPLDQAMSAARGDQLSRADVVLWCEEVGLSTEFLARNAELRASIEREHSNVLRVMTKAELWSGTGEAAPEIAVSALLGTGFTLLANRVSEGLARSGAEDSGLGIASARCRESLRGATTALAEAEKLAQSSAGDELIALEVRQALDQLGTIVGAVYTDDLLDRIFSKFCIGK